MSPNKAMPRILLLLTLLTIPFALGTELPNPPSGYTWKQILDEQSALLVPAGWHFKSQHGKNTDGFFVSKENIDTEGKFETGLSLNVIRQVERSTGLAPQPVLASHYRADAKEQKGAARRFPQRRPLPSVHPEAPRLATQAA